MDITSTPDEHLPQYPKKNPARRRRADAAQRLAGDVIETKQPSMPCFTKTDCRIARRIIKNGMNNVQIQLLGGTPIEADSEMAKMQERKERQHQRVYNKLLRLLDCLEHK